MSWTRDTSACSTRALDSFVNALPPSPLVDLSVFVCQFYIACSGDPSHLAASPVFKRDNVYTGW